MVNNRYNRLRKRFIQDKIIDLEYYMYLDYGLNEEDKLTMKFNYSEEIIMLNSLSNLIYRTSCNIK